MSTTRLPTAKRQQQIAEAALQILSNYGARRLTAAALAKEVGIAEGTIFRHFRNKEEIVLAAIDLFEAALESTFPPTDGEPLERLGQFLVQRLELVRENPHILRLASNDRLAEAAGERCAERVEQIVERSANFVRRCLEEAQNRGQVTQDTPISLLVWMVIGVIRAAASGHLRGASAGLDLSVTAPMQVREALERFLRSTAKETTQ